MSATVAIPGAVRNGCAASVRRWHFQLRNYTTPKGDANPHTANVSDSSPLRSRKDIEDLLAHPSWAVSSLLPPKDTSDTAVTRETLRKLLKLSALPPPDSAKQEEKMLRDLRSQVHFVRQMQKIDTSGVEPLVAIRDETQEAARETEYNLENMADELNKEEVVGKYYKRIRRKKDLPVSEETIVAEDWDVLRSAKKKEGRFFVVKSNDKVED